MPANDNPKLSPSNVSADGQNVAHEEGANSSAEGSAAVSRPEALESGLEREFGADDTAECPKCGLWNGVSWRGGDSVVNLGGALFTRVDWYTCELCGHKWSESYDHD